MSAIARMRCSRRIGSTWPFAVENEIFADVLIHLHACWAMVAHQSHNTRVVDVTRTQQGAIKSLASIVATLSLWQKMLLLCVTQGTCVVHWTYNTVFSYRGKREGVRLSMVTSFICSASSPRADAGTGPCEAVRGISYWEPHSVARTLVISVSSVPPTLQDGRRSRVPIGTAVPANRNR